MNEITQPAQIPHNLHYSSAMAGAASQLQRNHVVAGEGFRLVGAVGVEFMKTQNPKEFSGIRRTRKSFVVCVRNCCCPRIAPAVSSCFLRG